MGEIDGLTVRGYIDLARTLLVVSISGFFCPMTAQIPDAFLFPDKKFSVAGVNGEGLFNPATHHLKPVPRITSCWRGFVCTYKAPDNLLLLDALQLNLGQEGPMIEDVAPVFATSDIFDNTYQNLGMPVNFTGTLLVAEGFIRELYVHMGFHPAWKYETVFELIVSQGTVLQTRDVSQSMAELRDKMIRQPLQPHRDASSQDVQAWIASTFKRNYKS
jgi:hypothetical protein